MDQRVVRVTYHEEPEGWWANSPDLDGFVAGAETLTETRRLVREGVPFYLDLPAAAVEIEETGPSGEIVYDWTVRTSPDPAFARPGTATLSGKIAVKHRGQSGMRVFA